MKKVIVLITLLIVVQLAPLAGDEQERADSARDYYLELLQHRIDSLLEESEEDREIADFFSDAFIRLKLHEENLQSIYLAMLDIGKIEWQELIGFQITEHALSARRAFENCLVFYRLARLNHSPEHLSNSYYGYARNLCIMRESMLGIHMSLEELQSAMLIAGSEAAEKCIQKVILRLEEILPEALVQNECKADTL